MTDSEKLAKMFEEAGYETFLHCPDVVGVRGKGIIAAYTFEYYVDEFRSNVHRHFIAENEEAFNKWNQCPLVMPIEEAFNDFSILLKHLEWLGSPAGYEYSDSFSYLDCPQRLPHTFPWGEMYREYLKEI